VNSRHETKASLRGGACWWRGTSPGQVRFDGEEARRQLHRALQLDPGHVECLRELGSLAAPKQGEELLRRAVAADPTDPDTRFRLAGCLMALNDTAGACNEWAGVATGCGDDGWSGRTGAWFNLAMAALQADRQALALPYLLHAHALRPNAAALQLPLAALLQEPPTPDFVPADPFPTPPAPPPAPAAAALYGALLNSGAYVAPALLALARAAEAAALAPASSQGFGAGLPPAAALYRAAAEVLAARLAAPSDNGGDDETWKAGERWTAAVEDPGPAAVARTLRRLGDYVWGGAGAAQEGLTRFLNRLRVSLGAPRHAAAEPEPDEPGADGEGEGDVVVWTRAALAGLARTADRRDPELSRRREAVEAELQRWENQFDEEEFVDAPAVPRSEILRGPAGEEGGDGADGDADQHHSD